MALAATPPATAMLPNVIEKPDGLVGSRVIWPEIAPPLLTQLEPGTVRLPVIALWACENVTVIGPLSPEPMGGASLVKLPVHVPVRFGRGCARTAGVTTTSSRHVSSNR